MKNILFLVISLVLISISGVFIFVTYLSVDLPDLDQIGESRINQSTKIYDREGEVLLFEIHGEEKRTVVDFNKIPDIVKQATIAAEDKNFYSHFALDLKGIARSIFIDITQNKRIGGSTITQQLAKNVFLSADKTISRKVKELIIALKLERRFSKDEILGLYLNQIPYGGNAYGIEAASQTYYNKSVQDLTLGEAAILVALPQAPSYYSPYGSHKDSLLERQNYVLEQMVSLNYITEEEKDKAIKEEIEFAPQSTSIKAPHFVMMVIDYLGDKYGEDMIQTGGLKVKTTLDWELQQIAEKSVFEKAERNFELYEGRNAALVAQEAKTGQILALVGSYDYFDVENEGNFNVAYQGLRQPGSAFKPFAYYTAFTKGYTPDTVLMDTFTEFDVSGRENKSYKPHNFDNIFRGPINMRDSLAQSVNVTAVKTLYLAGIDETIKTATDFGITTLGDRSRFGLSLVLGGGEVRLTELVGAYSVFARDGEYHPQKIVTEVRDSQDNLLEEYKEEAKLVAEPQKVRLINDVLSDVESRSGLFSGSLGLTVFNNYQVALKTGTTNDYVDAWTLGYTPDLVVGVWAGNNRREPMKQQGSSLLAALPLWSDFFGQAVTKYKPETFKRPDLEVVEKPILKGDYLFGKQVHSILYYIDKKDPLGAIPNNPEKDDQFTNWEGPVLEWAKNNISDFNTYNQSGLFNYRISDGAGIEVNIKSPTNGSFVKNTRELVVDIKSESPIKEIRFFVNNNQVGGIQGQFGTDYIYRASLSGVNWDIQNELIVIVKSESGAEKQEKIIVFE